MIEKNFLELKKKKNKTVDDHIKLLINSFGNNSKGYLYSKKICHAKYKLALAIIKKETPSKDINRQELIKTL